MPMMMPSTQTGGLAAALNPQTGGLLQRLLGTQAQSGIGQRLTDLLNPQVALPMAGALMGGRTFQSGLGDAMAMGGFGLGKLGETRKVDAERQRTKDYLAKSHPELAQMVDMGLPIEDAWKEALTLDHPGKNSLINAGDGNLYDPDTGKWITAPGGSTKAPQVVELFDEASGQPYKATWDAATNSYKRVGGVKARAGMSLQTNADGTVSLTQGDLSNLPKLTDAEGKSAGFLERGRKSDAVIKKLESQGTSISNATIGQLPVVGNYLRSSDAQKYDQAKRDFVNAVLRRESGAVISKEEFANAEQQYFPQPGDGPEVIAQKRANREAALRGFEISAGQGAGLVTPEPMGGGTTSSGVQWSVEP